jgi:peptidoglycan/LPS O-acetylase OafA/YrhL
MKESTNLDLLRSAAVLCVFFAHLADALTKYRYHYAAHQFGQLGVILFFVHTSLVLLQSLDRNRLPGRAMVWSFYLRRAFRLYPLSMLFVTGAVLLTAHGWVGWRAYVANLTLTQNLFYVDSVWGVLWSLPLEIQMYIALPVLFLAFRERPAWWIAALLALSVPAGMIQMALSPRFNVIAYAPCFLGGVLAWRVLRGGAARRVPAWAWPFALAALIGAWAAVGDSHVIWNRAVFCVSLGAAIPMFANLRARWIVVPSKQIAKYSYGIYLSHPLALNLAMKQTGLLRWTVLTVVAVGMPFLLFHLIEDPMIRLGKRIADSRFGAERRRAERIPLVGAQPVAQPVAD